MRHELPVRERGVCCPLPAVMPDDAADRSVAVLKALADPVRLRMVAALAAAASPVCVCDFASAFGLSQPTISHHVARLREAGLVEVRKVGLWAHYSLRTDLGSRARALVTAATAAG